MEPTPNVALRIAVAASGWTQRHIARRARIHEVRFSAIARGRINPSAKEQRRIAKVLSMDVDQLFGDSSRLVTS